MKKRDILFKLIDYLIGRPNYNTTTKKIKGCKINTISWFHEMRHAEQDKNKWIKLLWFIHHHVIMFTFFLSIIVLTIKNYPSKIIIWLFIISYLPMFYIEIDAQIIGIYHYHLY